jgi:hypothetical protein
VRCSDHDLRRLPIGEREMGKFGRGRFGPAILIVAPICPNALQMCCIAARNSYSNAEHTPRIARTQNTPSVLTLLRRPLSSGLIANTAHHVFLWRTIGASAVAASGFRPNSSPCKSHGKLPQFEPSLRKKLVHNAAHGTRV